MRIPLARPPGQTVFRLVGWLTPLVFGMVLFLPVGDESPPLPVKTVFVGIALLMLLAFVAAPRRLTYTLGRERLTIRKLTGQHDLPYAGMTVRRASRPLGTKFGGTALYGYYSGNHIYEADGLKRVTAAASNPHGGVLVAVPGKTLYLTPADPEAFLKELSRRGAKLLG